MCRSKELPGTCENSVPDCTVLWSGVHSLRGGQRLLQEVRVLHGLLRRYPADGVHRQQLLQLEESTKPTHHSGMTTQWEYVHPALAGHIKTGPERVAIEHANPVCVHKDHITIIFLHRFYCGPPPTHNWNYVLDDIESCHLYQSYINSRW